MSMSARHDEIELHVRGLHEERDLAWIRCGIIGRSVPDNRGGYEGRSLPLGSAQPLKEFSGSFAVRIDSIAKRIPDQGHVRHVEADP